MRKIWHNSDYFAGLYMGIGILGTLMNLLYGLMGSGRSWIDAVGFWIFVILFLTITIAGAISLKESRYEDELSDSMQQYHRWNASLGSILWVLTMPMLLGTGIMQWFTMAIGYALFIYPSIALMRIHHIVLFPKREQKSWRQWVADGALMESGKE
ncbi:hypothetical protein [Entomospira culicis]|uniref:Uncharacterized protein n=1 Tax=Entomospira culicis TaxID=2719989 RepID=A0A968KUP6_9SPIO|nr:hypothetical protein [Entomospira culicis]NIZ19311.1 hypothetical protein [Entomospira culicis]NIZ69784.1 hypothetical protein [Entomospira culicis]WDI36895.1 hypothetical protein PVA46_06095 [Entomospira culicis]WDI38524.1 hypothetical protein PVA47_06105 [Entomospira culicis]